MIFDIDEIPEGGLDIELCQDPKHFDLDLEDCSLSRDVAVTGILKKMKKDVFFQGHCSTEVQAICARCLEPFPVQVEDDVNARYVPGVGRKEHVSDLELHGSEVDTEEYFDNKVDLTQAVHDQIILALPTICLCDEACKGLCPQCGANLNQGECACPREAEVDPRLAVLKNFKSKS